MPKNLGAITDPKDIATKEYVDGHHDSTKQDTLPVVTNDRFLHTNSSTGTLEWAEIPDEVFWVTFTSSGGVWSCDKTMEEIRTAYNAGETVIAKHLDKRYLISYISTIRITFSEVVSPVGLYQVELISYRSSGITSTSYGYRAVENPNESEILNGNGVYIYNWDDDDSAWQNIDSSPTEDSTNLIESGGVYTALASKQNSLPTVTNDRYLHTNSSTGALEWSEVNGYVPTSGSSHIDLARGESVFIHTTNTYGSGSNNGVEIGYSTNNNPAITMRGGGVRGYIEQATNSGTIDLSGAKIKFYNTGKVGFDNKVVTEVATPVNSTDAANKGYVDDNASKVEASTTNGNIKINSTETTVYTHPGSGTNPHGTTATDIGLGNVGNFKAVSTVANQGLTDTEKSNARTNIGAGTSNLAIGTTSTTAAAGDHTHSQYLTSHQDISGKANLASPAFTGTPTAPTAASGTNTTQIATTAFVQAAVAGSSLPYADTDGTGVVYVDDAWTAQLGYAYKEDITGTIVNNVTLTGFQQFSGALYGTSDQTPNMKGIKVGEVYEVIWNGTTYNCTAFALDNNGNVGLGNPGLLGGTMSTEPFIYITSITVGGFNLIDAWGQLTNSNATVTVSGYTTLITTFNPNYLPNSNIQNGARAYSTVEGYSTTASNVYAHAEGSITTASGPSSHAEGVRSTASGDGSHAEGRDTIASGIDSHAEGNSATASGYISHAEGSSTASGYISHAEGSGTASGDASHAEGYEAIASGNGSHAEGAGTIAASDYQHVQGQYNVEDSNSTYADIIGWGSDNARKNIEATTITGDKRLRGNVYVDCNTDSTGGNKLASESYVTNKTGDLSTLSTTAKGTLVAAVNELFTSVSSGKATVASAITDKGVTTASDATFATMATNIAAIPTGITPSGNKAITVSTLTGSNIDVANYATASYTVEDLEIGSDEELYDLDNDGGISIIDNSGNISVINNHRSINTIQNDYEIISIENYNRINSIYNYGIVQIIEDSGEVFIEVDDDNHQITRGGDWVTTNITPSSSTQTAYGKAVVSPVPVSNPSTITANGVYTTANYWNSVTVNVPIPSPSGNKAITATTSTQTGIDVTDYATVSVAPTPTETKTVTSNGTVTPTSGKYLSSVTVNIPTYDGSVE